MTAARMRRTYKGSVELRPVEDEAAILARRWFWLACRRLTAATYAEMELFTHSGRNTARDGIRLLREQMQSDPELNAHVERLLAEAKAALEQRHADHTTLKDNNEP